MRVVDYQGIKQRQRRRQVQKRRVRRGFIMLVAVCFTATYGYIAYQLPLPVAGASPIAVSSDISAQTDIVWPGYGQAALGNPEYGLLETNGSQEAAPTASVAKIMTALAVLRRKPLVTGQPMPIITIDESDVAAYNYYQNNNGSLVKVELGEELTEYQALQALLLPSANNMSETLARWAFGSLDAYTAYANDLAKSLGMKNSYFADSSGFSPRTVSTASDLVLLGLAALNEPKLVEIMSQSSAVIPVAGEIRNTNRILGQSGVIGMKTGNTDQAGGCFMVAGQYKFEDRTITTVGVIMGAPSISRAMTDAVPLITSAYRNYQEVTITNANQVVADYRFAWGSTNKAYVKDSVKILGWKGADVTISLVPEPIEAKNLAGSQVGALNIATPLAKKSVPLYLLTDNDLPSLNWRLKRLIGINN